MSRFRVVGLVLLVLAVLGFGIASMTTVGAHGTVVGGPYKSEGNTDHGHLNADGTAVILNNFNDDWPGDHFCNLTVKGGPNGEIFVAEPQEGVEYFTPGVNPAGQHYEVSHWIIFKCEEPTVDTTTTVVDTTTTVVEETTTTPVEETTTTPVVEDTTTTVQVEDTTTTAVVEETTTTPAADEEPTTTANRQEETTTTVAEETTTTAAAVVIEDTTTAPAQVMAASTVAQPVVAAAAQEQNGVLPATGGDPGSILVLAGLCLLLGFIALLVVWFNKDPARV